MMMAQSSQYETADIFHLHRGPLISQISLSLTDISFVYGLHVQTLVISTNTDKEKEEQTTGTLQIYESVVVKKNCEYEILL